MKEFVDLYYETAGAGHRARSGPQPALAGAHHVGGALPLRRHDAAVPERLVQPADHERVRRGRRGRPIAEDYRADGRLMFALAISEPDGDPTPWP